MCGLRIQGTGFKIPPRSIPDSKRSVFSDSGFQKIVFRIPQTNIFWIATPTSKCFLDSGIRSIWITQFIFLMNIETVLLASSVFNAHTEWNLDDFILVEAYWRISCNNLPLSSAESLVTPSPYPLLNLL